MVEAGQEAPEFELRSDTGETIKLSSFRGRPVVVYFYPKASTPGCTTQACGIRDHGPDYAEAGAVVLGISPDPVAKIKKFADEYALGFCAGWNFLDDDVLVHVDDRKRGSSFVGDVDAAPFLVDPESLRA